MAMPVGIQRKTKDNSKKLHRNREDWQKGKRLGRPAQQFNAETGQWGKILLPKKVTD
jgi:hypothetical protein